MSRTTFACILLSCLPGVVAAATLHVPGSYPTIQAAFDVAQAGDEVVLAAGDYVGVGNMMLTAPSLDLTIRSDGGPISTRIVGDGPYGQRWALRVRPGQGNTVTILGIGFHSLAGQDGSAISATGFGALVVRDCRFVECASYPEESDPPHAGAVLVAGEIDAELTDCTFLRNQDNYDGAGLGHYGRGETRVTDCVFEENGSGAILSAGADGRIVVSHSRFANNGGGGLGIIGADDGAYLEVYDSTIISNSGGIAAVGDALVERCTIAGNKNYWGVVAYFRGSVQIIDSIIRANCSWDGTRDLRAYGPITVTCCALDSTGIEGWENITVVGAQVWEDPLFCDPEDCLLGGEGEEERYMLDVNSPCTAWRSPCGVTIGALGVGCGTEILGACCLVSSCIVAPPGECSALGGAYLGDGSSCEPGACDQTPVIETGWGALKARFR